MAPPPIPYKLWKLKDIITPCEQVMASKGKCCWQRPISRNADHWCSRVYKRVGSVLRLVCLTLPESSVNFVRSHDLLQFIQQRNGSVRLEEVTRIILHVGDIANCYDELDHDDCLDGVAWALKMMPTWHRTQNSCRPRRAIGRYSIDRFSRKDITAGPDLTSDRTRIELTTDQVISVCEFDIRNSILCIKGELWKRLLGAPMGGFLSALYAMLNFAYVEHKCVEPLGLFIKMGIPGGVKQYMDDIIVALLCRNSVEGAAAEAFVSELSKPAVYPPLLCLNMEPRGNQEFLEANVTVHVAGTQLALSRNNKVAADIVYRLPPYRQRLSPKMPRAANRTVLSGILTRILQSTCSDNKLITMCILALQYEVRHCHLEGHPPKQVTAQAQFRAREREEENAEGALAKASPASAK